jgi:streptogramin lyase
VTRVGSSEARVTQEFSQLKRLSRTADAEPSAAIESTARSTFYKYQHHGSQCTIASLPLHMVFVTHRYALSARYEESMTRVTALLILCAGALGAVNKSAITEYPVPTANSEPESIQLGPDGALWFTETAGNKIGRITTAGVITEYPLGGSAQTGSPWDIVVGPDGALWFTETLGSKIGRITTAGVITNQWVIPTQNSGPRRIVVGPDGAMWFTESSGNKIGRITTAGVITEYPIPTPKSGPSGITAGPDGAIWFNENGGNQTVRMTTEGVITNTYPAPMPDSVLAQILPGPDGNLWITENWNNKVGRLTTSGLLTEWPTPSKGSIPSGLGVGPDGALWFTEFATNVNNIGRITTDGIMSEYPIPTAASEPWEITAGPDGAMWFVEYTGNKIGRIPACGLGMTVYYLTTNEAFGGSAALNLTFGLGITTSAVWTTTLYQNGLPVQQLWSESVNPTVPPVNTFKQYPLSPMGVVQIVSGLFQSDGTAICLESQSVNTGTAN